MLHMKLKIGNKLRERLQASAENAGVSEDLKQLLKTHGLDKNRKDDRIIHQEYKGNEVTKFRYLILLNGILNLAKCGMNFNNYTRIKNSRMSSKQFPHSMIGRTWFHPRIWS